jgi:4-amino-4-deoxy-L-arabinose transferase-like glycosyltransferase
VDKSGWAGALEHAWVPYVVLAVPFVVAIAALRGLTVALPMFHGSDEVVYHYPTILRFSRELPFPDLAHYRSAQTPLFHVLMAYVGKVIGFQLWRLRLVETLISYLVAVASFRLFAVRLAMGRLQALVLALLVVLSPYVYSTSFRLQTDNLALLFAVLMLDRLERFRESRTLGPFIVACACAAAGVLTRQSSAFLFGVAGLYALAVRGVPLRLRAAACAVAVFAFVPAAILFLTWHGLTPPGGDTSSCGLCGASSGVSGSGLRLSAAELALAVTGLYGAVLFAPVLPWRDLGRPRRFVPGAVAAAVVCLAILLASPATPHVHTVPAPTAGFLWQAAAKLPNVVRTSLLFWLLVPVGGALLWWRYGLTRRRLLMVAFLACFLVSTLVIRLSWQKYVDPYALLLLLITAAPEELDAPARLAGALVVAAGFIAYTLSFAL